jgi:hypothetical protein
MHTYEQVVAELRGVIVSQVPHEEEVRPESVTVLMQRLTGVDLARCPV